MAALVVLGGCQTPPQALEPLPLIASLKGRPYEPPARASFRKYIEKYNEQAAYLNQRLEHADIISKQNVGDPEGTAQRLRSEVADLQPWLWEEYRRLSSQRSRYE